jgi:hypothetical protein
LSGRAIFVTAAALVLAIVLFALVARPAVERGGWGELGIVAVSMLAILLAERWLRTR